MNPAEELDEYETQYAIRPNKSAIKRENAALEDLGVELINLPDERLHKLDLPPALFDAIKLARTIERHHGALKRQRKFIAKLLRDMDADAIQEQLAGSPQQNAQQTYLLHLAERWRNRLLNGDDHDLNALMAEHPDADRPKLRQLLRDARKEQQSDTPPRSARLLFKYLRELLSIEETDTDDES